MTVRAHTPRDRCARTAREIRAQIAKLTESAALLELLDDNAPDVRAHAAELLHVETALLGGVASMILHQATRAYRGGT